MSSPYIQGLIHDGDGHTTQFLIGPDGYRQWGWTGRGDTQAIMAANQPLLEAMEEAANRADFFEDPHGQQDMAGAS
jgi:hypothetical protein